MFIINLTYKTELDKIEHYFEQHIEFLDKHRNTFGEKWNTPSLYDDYSMTNWYMQALKNVYKIKGRARRKEFWWFVSINMSMLIMTVGIDSRVEADWAQQLYLSCLLLFTLFTVPVTIRRLHDVNISGWWVLIPLLPIIGYFKILILLASDTYPDMNRWGIPAKTLS